MPVDPRIQAALNAPLKGSANLPKFKVGGKAYPKAPGTGPAGETCRSCANATPHDCSRRYWKCGLVNWTKGPATDIRLKSPACAFWSPHNG